MTTPEATAVWVELGETPWPDWYDTDPRMAWVKDLLAEDPGFLAALTAPRGEYAPGPIPPPERTLGPQWCRWIVTNCRMGEGDVFGRPPRIALAQKAWLWKLAEVERDGRRRFDVAVLSMGKGGGKSPQASWVGSIDLAGPSVVCKGVTADGRKCPKCVKGFKADGTPHGVRRVSPDVVVMASSWEQADLIFDEIRTTFEVGPLAPHARAMRGVVQLGGLRGKARRIRATPTAADGSKGTTLLVDEIHEFTTETREKAYDVASGGTSKREDGLTLITSTAGADLSTLWGRMVSQGMSGKHPSTTLFVYLQASDEIAKKPILSDEDIAEGIRQCNPLVRAGIANLAKLVAKFKSMPLYRALRYYFNRWAPSGESWLPRGAWDACKGELVSDPNLPTWVGADMALKRDSAAIVIVQLREDGRFQAWSKIWLPDGELIDQSECDQYLRDVCAVYNVVWVAADEAWWPTLPELERGDPERGVAPLPIFRMPQQGKNMVFAYARTYQVITGRQVVQAGEPDFSDQIVSAVAVSTDGGWRLKKGKNKRRIDSAPAMAGAIFASTIEREVEEPMQPMTVV